MLSSTPPFSVVPGGACAMNSPDAAVSSPVSPDAVHGLSGEFGASLSSATSPARMLFHGSLSSNSPFLDISLTNGNEVNTISPLRSLMFQPLLAFSCRTPSCSLCNLCVAIHNIYKGQLAVHPHACGEYYHIFVI